MVFWSKEWNQKVLNFEINWQVRCRAVVSSENLEGQVIIQSFLKAKVLLWFLPNTAPHSSVSNSSEMSGPLSCIQLSYCSVSKSMPSDSPRTTDTQWRHKSKIHIWKIGPKYASAVPKIWDWEWIFGRAVQWRLFPLWASVVRMMDGLPCLKHFLCFCQSRISSCAS